MDRDEVLKAVEIAVEEASAAVVGLKCTGQGRAATWYSRQAELLRAAAEIIRESGWRPIAEAPENKWLIVGKYNYLGWVVDINVENLARTNGYTHYLPEPAPPAREVENG